MTDWELLQLRIPVITPLPPLWGKVYEREVGLRGTLKAWELC
jgi:hypothetical protein